MITLEGGKVRLRALEPEDVDILYRWENDTRVWEVSETVAPYSREVLRYFIENQRHDIYRTRQMRLVVCALDDDRAVGLIDLFDFEPRHQKAAVGIVICDETDRRQGYAAEALSLVCDYARDRLYLRQLHCTVHTDNEASIALFRSCGFTESGILKDWSRSEDGWRDEYLFQKLFR